MLAENVKYDIRIVESVKFALEQATKVQKGRGSTDLLYL
jgi:hypothetical protein